MSTPPESTAPRFWPRLAKTMALILAASFLLMLVTAAVLGPGGIQVLVSLAIGWMGFLERTLPKISWNWDLVAMGIICAASIIFLSQWFMNWITRNVALSRNRAWSWPWKWTACGLGSVGLLFVVGLSVGGIAHQIGWMASSDETWRELKGGMNPINEMRQLDSAFQQAMLELNADLTKARRELNDPNCRYLRRGSSEPPLIQQYHFLLIMDPEGKLSGTIMFPRDPLRRVRSGGMYWFENSNDFVSAEKLRGLIEQHQKQMVAL